MKEVLSSEKRTRGRQMFNNKFKRAIVPITATLIALGETIGAITSARDAVAYTQWLDREVDRNTPAQQLVSPIEIFNAKTQLRQELRKEGISRTKRDGIILGLSIAVLGSVVFPTRLIMLWQRMDNANITKWFKQENVTSQSTKS